MHKILITIFSISLSVFLILENRVYAQAGVTTYQDCLILATRHGLANSKTEARNIEQSCRAKFPTTAPPLSQISKPLSKEELGKLDIWNKSDSEKKPGAVVYNGNKETTITQLQVLVTPTVSKGKMDNFFSSEEYELNIEVMPFKTFTIDLPAESQLKGDLRWKILNGNGY